MAVSAIMAQRRHHLPEQQQPEEEQQPPGQQVQAVYEQAMDATREYFAERAAAPGQQLQYQQNLRDDDATWEYFDKGGWFAMDERTNNILNMAYCDEDEECGLFVDDDKDNMYKYTWNFENLTQKRFW